MPVLAEKAEKAERDSMLLLPSETLSEMSVATRSESHWELVKSSGPTLGQIDAYAAGLSGGDDRTMILRKTNSWVAQLYEQWTTLSANNTEEESSFDAAAVADLADMDNAKVSMENPHQARETPQTDNQVDESGSQQAGLTVTVENKPHNHQKCDCIRAKMERPEYCDELRGIDRWLEAWLDSCQGGSKLPGTCEEFLQKSTRRNELDHEYMANCMWPLYKKYQARVSDLLLITDSEIAELCCQKEEAIARSDLNRSNRIEYFELPRLLERRRRLEHAYQFDPIKVIDGFLILEPSNCEIANRDPSSHKPRNEAKEAKATTAKLRDQNQRRDRSERLNRHAYVEDDSSSDSNISTHATDAPIRTTSSRREYRDDDIYEVRRPPDYFDFSSRESFNSSSRDRFDDEPPGASAHKYEVPPERPPSVPTQNSSSAYVSSSGLSPKVMRKLHELYARKVKQRQEREMAERRHRTDILHSEDEVCNC